LLSLRDVSELLLARGIILSYETIREWGIKFGNIFANETKHRAPRRGDKWHMDEMCVVMNGKNIGYGGQWIKTVMN
jgi:putative transposase